ncbi:MAG: hypothetical protein NXI27_31565, partial [Alphaproteobacteria bacterium]|nr:hypothetical protein [Alphaproteobacteria bacterium]
AGQSGISRKTALQWIGCSVALAIAFYAHAIAAFVAVLFGLWILLAVVFRLLPWNFLWQALIAGVLFGLLIVPGFLPFFWHLDHTLGENFWIPDPSFDYVYSQMAAVYAYPKWGKLLVAALLVWGLWSMRRRPLICLLLAFIIIGFPLMVLLFSFSKPIFITRVISWSGFVSVLVLAAGLMNLQKTLRWACVFLLLTSQAVALINFYPATPERSPYEPFEEAFSDFDPGRDTLVLGNQMLEPALRWYFPQIFRGDSYGFLYGDRNRHSASIIDRAFRSEFVLNAEADHIQLSDGQLFVFQEAEISEPVSSEMNQVQQALDVVIGGYPKIAGETRGRFRLDIYKVE